MSKDEPLSPTTIPEIFTNSTGEILSQRASARLVLRQQSEIYKMIKNEQQKLQLLKKLSDEEPPQSRMQNGTKFVTPLLKSPEPSELSRWKLRSMWEMASVLNFFNVFRDHLNIKVEFSAYELETALLTPTDALGDIHIPLLKAIPPLSRVALTRTTWITVLCRKLRKWWQWVADGEIPVVASRGVEIEEYKSANPAIRLIMLRALCDIRVEQQDIKRVIDNAIKRGVHVSIFSKERIGGDSQGVNYWYEDDSITGHRLYREIRKSDAKESKGSRVLPCVNCEWETIATDFDEFQDVSEKLLGSRRRSEYLLAKKLKNDMLPEIEKAHKRKERLVKKRQRKAALLDSLQSNDDARKRRALRDRKRVAYTFDEYDQSINEAINGTKDEKKLETAGEDVEWLNKKKKKRRKCSIGSDDDKGQASRGIRGIRVERSPNRKRDGSAVELQIGLRRSERQKRNCIDDRGHEISSTNKGGSKLDYTNGELD